MLPISTIRGKIMKYEVTSNTKASKDVYIFLQRERIRERMV
jgi:hypothetical protein